MDSFLNTLPSHEREKIRKKLRSPEAYERLREKVKGPEDLEREMEKNAEFAEARLHLETDRDVQQRAQEMVRTSVKEQGAEQALEKGPGKLPERFEVIVIEKDGEPRLAVQKSKAEQGTSAPSGTVAEVFALKPALQQQILASFTLK